MRFIVHELRDIAAIPHDTHSLVWNINIAPEKHDIPYGVVSLIFGHIFNKKLGVDCIPNSVLILEFRDNFDQELEKGHIPNSVVNLSLST